jgi:hypothetical protein
MWLMTKFGFYSIVCAHQQEGIANSSKMFVGHAPDASGKMMVRSRRKQHLINLIENWSGPSLGSIVINSGTDYPYRLFIPQAVCHSLVGWLATQIDYTNFKSAQAAQRPIDNEYHHFLHRVWTEGVKMEDGTIGRGYVLIVDDPHAEEYAEPQIINKPRKPNKVRCEWLHGELLVFLNDKPQRYGVDYIYDRDMNTVRFTNLPRDRLDPWPYFGPLDTGFLRKALDKSKSKVKRAVKTGLKKAADSLRRGPYSGQPIKRTKPKNKKKR